MLKCQLPAQRFHLLQWCTTATAVFSPWQSLVIKAGMGHWEPHWHSCCNLLSAHRSQKVLNDPLWIFSFSPKTVVVSVLHWSKQSFPLHLLCICFAFALHLLCVCFPFALHLLCICFAFALHLLCICLPRFSTSVQPRGKATAAPRLRRCRFAFAQLVACRCISQQYLEFSIVLMCYDSVTVVPSSDPKDLLGKSFSCAVQGH